MSSTAPYAVGHSTIEVLDKGFVTLEDFMGGDLRTVNAAKVSNKKRSSEMGDREKGLIRYLLKHKHTSPFEHSLFTFYVKAPLFVVREWQRHRTWSFNEVSGRYIVFEPEFYIPDKMRIPAETNKQGSKYPDEEWAKEWYDISGSSVWQPLFSWNDVSKASIEASSAQAYAWYLDLVEHKKVAKELARLILPLNLYTEFFGTIDAHNLMKFLELRNAPDAQWEIQEYARALEKFFEQKMPVAYEAWHDLKPSSYNG